MSIEEIVTFFKNFKSEEDYVANHGPLTLQDHSYSGLGVACDGTRFEFTFFSTLGVYSLSLNPNEWVEGLYEEIIDLDDGVKVCEGVPIDLRRRKVIDLFD